MTRPVQKARKGRAVAAKPVPKVVPPAMPKPPVHLAKPPPAAPAPAPKPALAAEPEVKPQPPSPPPPSPPTPRGPQVPPPPRSQRDLVPVQVPVPRNEAEVVNNVLCRDVTEKEPTPDVGADGTIDILGALVNGIVNGTDLSAVKTDVERVLSHQRDKAEVIASVLQNHEFWRVYQWAKVRAENERRIFIASQRGDLTTTESLAFMRVANTEISGFMDRLLHATSTVPDVSAVEKVDSGARNAEKALTDQFKGTTPHGREIVRKRLYAEKKRAAAR